MKKIVISLIMCIIFLIPSTKIVYGVDTDSWVSDSFHSAKSFIEEKQTVSKKMSFLNDFLKFISNTVKAINYVLIILLGAISIISLAITGVRYIMASGNPEKLQSAKANLHTVFKGMLIGFGAFIIWEISMGIVTLILDTFAKV